MLEKIKDCMAVLIVFLSIMAGITYLFQHTGQHMQEYAIEHNCKWDYNDMCYTKDQKPWLFEY